MNTRERILATALRLFNETGTAAVSTNHMAQHANCVTPRMYTPCYDMA
jgi:AcrR family transcriptional regulator